MQQQDQQQEAPVNVSTILPLEMVDESIGREVRVLMKGEGEFTGTLLGFDDFVNMVLENVTEYSADGQKNSLTKVLLNGSNICMIVPQ